MVSRLPYQPWNANGWNSSVANFSSNALSSGAVMNSSRTRSPGGMALNSEVCMSGPGRSDLAGMSVLSCVPVPVADVRIEEFALGIRAFHRAEGLLGNVVVSISAAGNEHQIEMPMGGVVPIVTNDARRHIR